MDTPLLTELLQQGIYYKRQKGQIVLTFEEKSTVSLIKSGYVKRYLISKEGALGVQSIYGPGYVFPLSAAFIGLFGQKMYQGGETYYYQAVTDVEIYSINCDSLSEAVAKNPLIYKEVLIQTGTRLQSNIQQLENISLKNANWRVAHQLVFFARNFGQEVEAGTEIVFPLTQQDLADILSLTRETISRSVAKLRERELIIQSGTRYSIPDIDKLKAVYS